MEEKARAAVEAFCRWVEADGFDNREYDRLFPAMRDLAKSLGMEARWETMATSE